MKKVIFLDRDGTINVDHGYVSRAQDWKFLEGAPAALKKLQEAGFKLAIVTNQTAVGLGRYTVEEMNAVHDFMKAELAKEGVSIDAIAYCIDAPDAGCNCRKPSPGMAKQIEEQLGEIDYASSWTVGDKEKDVQFGDNIGTSTALIKSRHWDFTKLSAEPDLMVSSLLDFAEQI